MLSGNKLKHAYASSMAVVKSWPSWDVPEHWVKGWRCYNVPARLKDHGRLFSAGFCRSSKSWFNVFRRYKTCKYIFFFTMVCRDKVPTTVASEVGLNRDSSCCSPITSGLFLGERVGLPCLVFSPWRTMQASLFNFRYWCAAKIVDIFFFRMLHVGPK